MYKWKANLNVHGGQQEHGVHYWDTYAPVVTWPTVRFFLILSILLGWHSRQLDFVMAYPQAPAEMPLYMQLPQGYKCNRMTRKTHALKLIHNVYGQKQAGCVWNKYMDQGMCKISFTPSMFDPCLYYCRPIIFLVYIDNCIFLALMIGPSIKWSLTCVLAPKDSPSMAKVTFTTFWEYKCRNKMTDPSS